MYEYFQILLDSRCIKSIDVSRATGISAATLSDWKNGRSKPKPDKLQKIADFFNVSVDYLITGKEKSDLYSDDVAILFARASNNERAVRLLTYYMDMSEEDKKTIDDMSIFLAQKKNS